MSALESDAATAAIQIERVKADRERMRDALEHIANVCNGSRTSTRRLRWIALRCKSAVDDNEEWRDADLPVVDPLVDKLRELLKMVFPIAASEFRQLVTGYTAPEDQKRLEGNLGALIDTIEERSVHDDCIVLRQFLLSTRRNVPEINIEELRKGGDWIELT